jgi:hypothetical protein
MKPLYTTIILLLALSIGVLLMLPAPGGVRATTGEVTFSHATHKDKGECSTCHASEASESAKDNLYPKPEVCTNCHEAKDVRGFWSLDDNAALDKQYLVAKDRQLVFSHKFHLGSAGMKCETCHAGVLEDGNAFPEMKVCVSCHSYNRVAAGSARTEKIGSAVAANQCEACHTTLVGLKPANHRSVTFTRMHGRYAMNGESDRDCAQCHSSSFCQSCHSPTNSVPKGVMSDQFYVSGYARGEKMDDGKELTLQQVHALTYRYTHGFDARAQSSTCQRCHTENFCSDCHQNGYDAAGTRIVPQSHRLAGFVSITGGKAMNRHAKLAEMDLQSCATCHNVDGGDPICATCHSTGIVKGETR